MIYGQPEAEDESAITEMYETYLNAGASIRGYVREGLQDDGFVGVKCVDSDTGRMVGILCARPGIQFTCDHPELVEIIQKRWGTKGIYTGDMLIVDPAYRGRGIAAKMAVLLKEGLMRRHAVCMVMEQWLRYKEGDVPALNPMKHAGEAVVITIDRHFYKDLADYGLTCPECGANCRCGALISVLEFHYPPSEGESHAEEKR